MATLLLVHHSPSAHTARIAEAVREGTALEGLESITLVERNALDATPADVLAADGYLLGTTANFGYISGALKHFFDTTFYETNEQSTGRPFSFWIHGGYDTTGAEQAMRSITTGYKWKLAADPVIFTGEVTDEHLDAATALGATVAATLF